MYICKPLSGNTNAQPQEEVVRDRKNLRRRKEKTGDRNNAIHESYPHPIESFQSQALTLRCRSRRTLALLYNARDTLQVAASLARVHGRHQVRRQVRAELVHIARIDVVLVAQRNVNNIVRQSEEVLRDLRRARVGAVQRGGEDRALARRVELEVDAALREDGCFELVQGGVEGEGEGVDGFGRVFEQPVLHHEADFELAFDYGEELGGARVGVRGVHAAGLDEGDGAGDAFAVEEGEVGFIGDEDAAAVAADGGGLEVEGEGVVDGFGVGEGHFALVVDGEEFLEAVDLGEVGVDIFCERGDGRCYCGR